MRVPTVLVAFVLLTVGCSSLDYDLGGLAFPVRATPAAAGERPGDTFTINRKSVLWLHGLLGRSGPDVAALLRETAGASAGVVDFRVGASASLHDWLVTHLTLGFVRMKTVTVTGRPLLR